MSGLRMDRAEFEERLLRFFRKNDAPMFDPDLEGIGGNDVADYLADQFRMARKWQALEGQAHGMMTFDDLGRAAYRVLHG